MHLKRLKNELLVYYKVLSEEEELLMIINAMQFGLRGKHRRADTRAIQKALKYARKHKNTTIYIPKGEYHIRRPLVIYDSTTLILDDEAVLKE